MRILVTGTQGQVVTALKAVSGDKDEIIALGRPYLDLDDPAGLEAPVTLARPDVIFSVAAYTAVDKAETEPETAMRVNGEAPAALAAIARKLGVPILHLSTDYVFDGSKATPYTEDDQIHPVNRYGESKRSGETGIAHVMSDHVILRTAWVYSPYGANFVKTMLRLAESRDTVSVVSDQRGCPTSAADIARTMLSIARRVVTDPDPTLRGTFHLASPDDASWAEFATAIFEGLDARRRKFAIVNPIPTSAYPTPAKRPANSRLDGGKLKRQYGIELPSWRCSLAECLDELLGKEA